MTNLAEAKTVFQFNGVQYRVTKDDGGDKVFASKLLPTGKLQRGRPSKFDRTTVVQLVEQIPMKI